MIRLFRRLVVGFGVLAGVAALCGGARADDVVTTKTVKFAQGKSSITLMGSVKGYDSIRYEVAAKEGQTFTAKLKSKSRFLYFNVLNKRTDVVLEGEPAPREVTGWSGKLPEAGIFVVQVYLVRAEARRGNTAKFSLTLTVNGTSTSSK